MEDPNIIINLRHLNSGAEAKYDPFWNECSKFLEESVGTTVNDRRHCNVTHIAAAISTHNLRDELQRDVQRLLYTFS